MRRYVLATIVLGGLLTRAASIQAATYDISFSGFVAAAAMKSQSGLSPDASILDGRPFTAAFLFDQSAAGTTGSGTFIVDLSGAPGVLPAPENPNSGEPKLFSLGAGAVLMPSGMTYFGQLNGTYGPSLSFNATPGSPLATLEAVIPELSVGRADSNGELDLALVSTAWRLDIASVPLPAALPLFASALFGIGIVSARRRRAMQDHGS